MNTSVTTRSHWDDVYSRRSEEAHSWYQADPAASRALIEAYTPDLDAPIIDIGAGASLLVDSLLARGFSDITLLDVSEQALDTVHKRLGEHAGTVTIMAGDITQWKPSRPYAIWHDRAVLHFLRERVAQDAYVDALIAGTETGSKVVISTFAPEGPERCSNLPVVRYSAEGLAELLGKSFALAESRKEDHLTPGGQTQVFTVAVFERL